MPTLSARPQRAGGVEAVMRHVWKFLATHPALALVPVLGAVIMFHG